MDKETGKGILFATSAYAFWGIIPIYFKLLAAISAGELLVHRVVWSTVFIALVLLVSKRIHLVVEHFRNPRTLLILSASSIFIAVNWVVFIWASNNDHLIETSLGYYINPLVNVLMGLLFLGERLRRLQWLAVGLAATGVVLQVVTLGKVPIISLTLALAFGFYGLMRKIVSVGSIEGLFIETILLLVPTLLYFFFFTTQISLQLAGDSASFALLLLAAGPVTSIPLMLFAAGVIRLNYSTIGFIQYLAPSIVLFSAVFIYHEPLIWQKTVTFICIWVALAIYSYDALRSSRAYVGRIV
ncbi:chloramphenicol-sensitive protein RarD [Alteromonadaceae bacterium Bs31]|nr:chloramphenicol-sensitive protein RarD [Alteromonadaceae bacterium Bs31]